jgi:hypothetical protein
MMVSLLFLIVVFIFNTTYAQAMPDAWTSMSASPGKHERCNNGGQLRGFDRAYQAAGQHGQQGREMARDTQLNRQLYPERSGLLERSVKPEWPDR